MSMIRVMMKAIGSKLSEIGDISIEVLVVLAVWEVWDVGWDVEGVEDVLAVGFLHFCMCILWRR